MSTKRQRSKRTKKQEEYDSENEKSVTSATSDSSLDRRLGSKRKLGFKEFLQTFVEREKRFYLEDVVMEATVELDDEDINSKKRKRRRKGYPNRSPAKTIDDVHMPNPSLLSLLNSISKAELSTPDNEAGSSTSINNANAVPSTIAEAVAQE